MNAPQTLWWHQACSDFEVYQWMGEHPILPCHRLHYLQMATEKLAKAYFWRSQAPPQKSHVAFVRFINVLVAEQNAKRRQMLVACFGLPNFGSFQKYARSQSTIAYQIQNMAPDLAGNGPNPEYPWPHPWPLHAPMSYKYSLWDILQQDTQGRRFLNFIWKALNSFPSYA